MIYIREDLLIEKLKNFYKPHPRIVNGFGDDTIILKEIPTQNLVFSVDATIEGRHFYPDILPYEQVGHRALAGALSDLAVIGATPLTFMVNLEIPKRFPENNVLRIYNGFEELNKAFCISPSGGNITASERVGLVLTVVGEIPRDRMISRNRAEPGDRVVVTGDLGRVRTALNIINRHEIKRQIPSDILDEILEKFYKPWPRINFMKKVLSDVRINASIDISDGLGADLSRIARASQVEIVIYEKKLPFKPYIRDVARMIGTPLFQLVVGSGEEYEIAFTLNEEEFEKLKRLGYDVTEIGEVTHSPHVGVRLVKEDGSEVYVDNMGYDHLKG